MMASYALAMPARSGASAGPLPAPGSSGGTLTLFAIRRNASAPASISLDRCPAPPTEIKIGISPKSDEQRIALARRILGDDMLLLVDVNGNHALDQTLESMRRTAPFGIHYYEEPLPPRMSKATKLWLGARRCPSRPARRCTLCSISSA
jgi:hypothetical protein